MSNTLTKLAAVATLVLAATATPAMAGRGGSEANINAAVQSGSVDAIIAEVERAEGLMCDECVTTVTGLLNDNRFAVREVAAWWIAKRPGLSGALAAQYMTDFTADSTTVRNAADFLGHIRYYQSLPVLQTAMSRGDLTVEAKLAIVGAVGYMAHVKGNPTLQLAMNDGSPLVRAAAVKAYRDVLNQTDVSPVVPRLGDSDAGVRAAAATVVGAYAVHAAVGTLETMVTSDPDPSVRRNAAWALGKIGDTSARQALTVASSDSSGLVRGVAKASLAQLGAKATR
jgi:HEAT repeat protein